MKYSLKNLRNKSDLDVIQYFFLRFACLPNFISWRIRKLLYKRVYYLLSQIFVTPFSGFILSDYYYSPEIDESNLSYLNKNSKPISEIFNLSPGTKPIIIYLQVDQLCFFINKYLDKIPVKFIIVTGKWNLPGLEESPMINQILSSPKLVAWFSQNQKFSHLAIEPFPYGLNLFTLPELFNSIFNIPTSKNNNKALVPFANIHPHLLEPARGIREKLRPYMSKPLKSAHYFREMSGYLYIISPPGDREDTYRHYECIALRSFPISEISSNFFKLFGENMIYSDNLEKVAKKTFRGSNINSLNEIVFLANWRKKIENYIPTNFEQIG